MQNTMLIINILDNSLQNYFPVDILIRNILYFRTFYS